VIELALYVISQLTHSVKTSFVYNDRQASALMEFVDGDHFPLVDCLDEVNEVMRTATAINV
jgi:hypothetical protein